MTPEFAAAFAKVLRDVKIDPYGADLVAVGVQRDDCLALLELLWEDGDTDPVIRMAMVAQWAVAVGVWLERARWEGS